LALKVAWKPVARLRSPRPQTILRSLGLPRPASGRKPDFGCNGKKKSQLEPVVKQARFLVVSQFPARGIYAASSAKTFRGVKRAEARAPGARIVSIRSTLTAKPGGKLGWIQLLRIPLQLPAHCLAASKSGFGTDTCVVTNTSQFL
jgi:hypothetical protein